MTHSIVVPPDLEDDLKLKATRMGLPLELYILEVLRQDVKVDPPVRIMDDRSSRFLELTEELIPIIEAGVLVQPDLLASTEIVDVVRDEREAEIINQKQDNH